MRRLPNSSIVAALSLGFASLLSPTDARSDDIDQLMLARDAFAAGQFEVAEARLRLLVGGETPQLRVFLVETARKYFAASLVFNGHLQEADTVFEAIFLENPDARLDSVLFTEDVIQRFNQVGSRLSERRAQLRAQRDERTRRDAEARQERVLAQQEILRDIATERVVLRTPRWMTFLPLGIGQFANGDVGLGGALLSLQIAGFSAIPIGLALTARNSCYSTWQLPYGDLSCVAPGWATAGIGGGILAVSLLVSIVQANTAWRPERIETRPRQTPETWKRVLTGLSVMPTADGAQVGVRLDF